MFCNHISAADVNGTFFQVPLLLCDGGSAWRAWACMSQAQVQVVEASLIPNVPSVPDAVGACFSYFLWH
jgi:hypothetical protein